MSPQPQWPPADAPVGTQTQDGAVTWAKAGNIALEEPLRTLVLDSTIDGQLDWHRLCRLIGEYVGMEESK